MFGAELRSNRERFWAVPEVVVSRDMSFHVFSSQRASKGAFRVSGIEFGLGPIAQIIPPTDGGHSVPRFSSGLEPAKGARIEGWSSELPTVVILCVFYPFFGIK